MSYITYDVFVTIVLEEISRINGVIHTIDDITVTGYDLYSKWVNDISPTKTAYDFLDFADMPDDFSDYIGMDH